MADKELIPEGISHDPKTGDFFLGSLSKQKIVRVDKNGKADGSLGLFRLDLETI